MIKTKYLLITFFICGIPINCSYAACYSSLETCKSRCMSGYCCPEQQTSRSCPAGWSYNSSQNLCTRDETTGSDSIGYYTQTYTSCSATVSTTTCYAVSSSKTSEDCERCLEQITRPEL